MAAAVKRRGKRDAPPAAAEPLFDAVARLAFGDWSWRAEPSQLADRHWGHLYATLELLRDDLAEGRRELDELRRIGSVHAGLWSGTSTVRRPLADFVEPLLQLLGPALGADQLAYWDADGSRRRLVCRWEWSAGGGNVLQGQAFPAVLRGNRWHHGAFAVRTDRLGRHGEDLPPGTAAFLARFDIGAVLLAPCLVGGRLRGLLAASAREPDRAWTERQKRLLEDAGRALTARLEAQRSAAALRTANARLRAEVRARTLELAETNRRLRQDAARRRVAEAALTEREALYRGLIETSPDAVLLCTPGGRVRMVNQAARRLYGESGPGLVGRRVHELVGAAGPSRRRLVGPDGTGEGEGRCPAPQGGTFVGEYRARRIVVPGRRPDALLVIVRDVTERRRTEQEAQQARQLEAVGTLAAGIAHDFNNLLTAVLNNIALARLQGGDDPGLRRGLADAETAALRASQLTRQLLTFARGGAPDLQPVKLRPLVVEAVRLCVAGTRVRGRIEVPRDLPPVAADSAQLGQVLHNLLLNAVQAQPEGGAVVVRARTVGASAAGPAGAVAIMVGDRGPGIVPEHLARIFDPYFTTKPGGLGLGLTTAHHIVRRHGGALRCTSAPGDGTTFEFQLAVARPAPVVRPAPRALASRGSARVLLLDDERRLRLVVGQLLTQAGYDAVAVGDGDAALEAWSAARAAGRPFDALLLDLTIPGGRGGRETLAEIRRRDRAVPAVAVSGYCDDPVMSEFRAHGFQASLPKPFGADDLFDVLGRVLRDRR